MRGEPKISSIYHQKNDDPPLGAEAERRNREKYKEAWHKLGLLVIDPEDINDEWERQLLINRADKEYGRRKAKG